jgi:predicted AlkP superfamily phosphohydrolase/phosphomutase
MGTFNKRRVLAVGLDSADYGIIRQWIDAGLLPNLAELFRSSAFGRLNGRSGYQAETPWTTTVTGCWPKTVGYWSPARYLPSYKVEEAGAYNFNEYSPFYDYARDTDVIAFDVPHTRLHDRTHGIQVFAWGAHSPQGPSESTPPETFEEISSRHGKHPALHSDDFLIWQTEGQTDELKQRLVKGVEQRTAAAIDLMQTRPWNLFIMAYGEPHSAGHGFWHLSQKEHALYSIYGRDGVDPMLDVYQAVDAAVAALRDAAPPDTHFVVFSQEGMKANSTDLPSWLFLPEVLFRHSFGGRAAFAPGDTGLPPPALRALTPRNWMREVWALRAGNGLIDALDRRVRLRLSLYLDGLFRSGLRPLHPLKADPFKYMPPMWYQPFWPHMKAFALPTFSDGYVRVNVRGRESAGIVDPADYISTREEIAGVISELKDPRTGKGMVREIMRTRTSPFDSDEEASYSDLIVLWTHEPTDVVDSPRYGRIGPAPYRRSGDHTAEGFFAVAGPDVQPGELPDGEIVDIAPTLLDLLGTQKPNHFEGRSRVGEVLRGALSYA